MTKALILTVRDWLEQQPGHPQIGKVHLIVGDFTCVEPASLQFAFATQVSGTFLEGAELAIATTPLIAFCQPCQAEYRPQRDRQYACPCCGAPLEEIRSGRELKIDRIEFLAEEMPPSAPERARSAIGR